MLDRCDRVQIAVADRGKAAARYIELLGGAVARHDTSRHLAAKRTVLAIGESEFELCEPDGAGATQDFLSKRGEGLMTAGYSTADPDLMMKRWEGLGVPFDREGEQLRGTIVSRTWTGQASDRRPPACAEGSHDERTVPFDEAAPGIRRMLSELRSRMAWLEVELNVLDESSLEPEALRSRLRDTLRQARLQLIATAGI